MGPLTFSTSLPVAPCLKRPLICSSQIGRAHVCTPIYTLSLHDALPIWLAGGDRVRSCVRDGTTHLLYESARCPLLKTTAYLFFSDRKSTRLHSNLHSFPTRRSSDLACRRGQSEIMRARWDHSPSLRVCPLPLA